VKFPGKLGSPEIVIDMDVHIWILLVLSLRDRLHLPKLVSEKGYTRANISPYKSYRGSRGHPVPVHVRLHVFFV
jgi:hypothetical protein